MPNKYLKNGKSDYIFMSFATFKKDYDKDLKLYLDFVNELRKDKMIQNREILIKILAKRLNIKLINEVF